MTRSAKLLWRGLLIVGLLLGTLAALPATTLADPTNLNVPNIPGAPPVPGAVAPAITPATTVGALAVSPATGVAGTQVTLSYKGLAADQPVTILWSTDVNTWSLDPEPDTVNYLGRVETPENVVLGQTSTDATGAFSTTVTVPQDWGGEHEFYAVINNVEEASGGFVVYRTATISPTSGPIGTPITITYHGLGASLYEGGAEILWDNSYVGALASVWTRGTAKVVIRATGPVGVHSIQIGNAISYLYLNVPQSPLPWTNGFNFNFRVTKGNGKLPPTQIDWPEKVAPTDNAITTLGASGLSGETASGITASLSKTYGHVGQPVTVTASGLQANTSVTLQWATVVGNRVNCKGICWVYATTPLGTAETSASGTLDTSINVPDGLGGWHVVEIVQNSQTEAQLPFNMLRSVVGVGVSSKVVKEGHMFTIHLKGLGWTQLDNTIAVDYDNSYIGYGCGFNSNGDVLLHIRATGGPGIHLIDMYPLLYTLSPSFANTPYGMVPYLTYAQDEPALALGYKLPAIRLAIRVIA